jgi:CxxC motif-containing protein (DUF1111 family)
MANVHDKPLRDPAMRRSAGPAGIFHHTGQRIFLLHDGRTTNLLQAIQTHGSQGSEANAVEQHFDNLSPSQQQDLLNFLRSL